MGEAYYPLYLRRLLVKDDYTLAELHAIIQITMSWSDTHFHQFIIRGKSYGIAYAGGISFSDNLYRISLKDFQFYPNERFIYEYNFFAHWELEIRVEKTLSLEQKKIYPVCGGGGRRASNEDCGDAFSFMQLADYYLPWRLEEMLLESIKCYQGKNKFDHELEEILRITTYWFDQHSFNRRYVNNVLKKLNSESSIIIGIR